MCAESDPSFTYDDLGQKRYDCTRTVLPEEPLVLQYLQCMYTHDDADNDTHNYIYSINTDIGNFADFLPKHTNPTLPFSPRGTVKDGLITSPPLDLYLKAVFVPFF